MPDPTIELIEHKILRCLTDLVRSSKFYVVFWEWSLITCCSMEIFFLQLGLWLPNLSYPEFWVIQQLCVKLWAWVQLSVYEPSQLAQFIHVRLNYNFSFPLMYNMYLLIGYSQKSFSVWTIIYWILCFQSLHMVGYRNLY